MKLKDAYEGYYVPSAKVSSLVEKLLFAGIGTVLVLSGGLGTSQLTITPGLKFALLSFMFGFVAACFQYLIQAHKWREFADDADSKLPDELPEDVDDWLDLPIGGHPDGINDLPWRAFWAKTVLAALGWLVVIGVFVTRVD